MLIGINADNTQALDFAFLENFLGVLDAVLGNLGDVDQTFDITFEAGKSAEFGQAGNNPFNQLADAVFFHTGAPGIFLQGTHGKSDALFILLDLDDLDLDFLPHFQDFTRVEGQAPQRKAASELDRDRAFLELVGGAVEDASDETGWANLGAVGSILTKKEPDFDSRNYGYGKLSDLLDASKHFEVKRQDKAIAVRRAR